MSENCPECGSSNTEHTDSHKSYVSMIEYQEIHYYECKSCGWAWSETR